MARKWTWTGIVGVALALAGCGDDGDGAGAEVASLRVLHLSPDAPAVDVFVNGATPPAVSDLEFGEGTGYLEIDAGSYDVDVAPAGMAPGDAVLSVDGLGLAANQFYTAVAFDALASIQALPLVDDYDGLEAGDIRVRAVHTASAVGQVDIWDVTGTPAPLYTDVDFGDVGAYVDLPAAAYSLGFDVDNDANPDLVFDLPSLPAGTVANVFAVSQGSDIYLLAQLQDDSVVRIDPRS